MPVDQGAEIEEQQQILKQEVAFNALGQPLASRTVSLSKGWKSGEGGSCTGVEIEAQSTTCSGISTGGSSTNSSTWPSLEREPFVSSFAGLGPAVAASVASRSEGPPCGPKEGEAPPRTFTSAVRGGIERLMRLSNWPQREAGGTSSHSNANGGVPPTDVVMSALPVRKDIAGEPLGGGLASQPLGICGVPGHDGPPFGVAHPEVRAHVVLLMELQRMRNELTQLHLQQQRQPSIVIQNHTAVAAKAENPGPAQQQERNSWLVQFISNFFSSRLNRLLFVCGVGVTCFMMLEHWRHSWRMAQLKRRMDSNLLLRGLQILEDSLGLRR